MANSTTASLLAAVDPDLLDKLVAVHKTPPVIEELIGDRPHSSAPQRWAGRGQAGVLLQTVTAGRKRFTCRRWLIEFFAAVDQARRAGIAPPRTPTQAGSAASEDDAVLRRHGLGQESAE